MTRLTLEEYKRYLTDFFVYECDNNADSLKKRACLLNQYSDDFLQSIISGTYNFINKLLALSQNEYPGYIRIGLDDEPRIDMIFLNLTGGYPSDTIVSDSLGNIYSLNIMREMFEKKLIIEPCMIESEDTEEEENGLTICSQVFSYYSYFQCDQTIMAEVRKRVRNS